MRIEELRQRPSPDMRVQLLGMAGAKPDTRALKTVFIELDQLHPSCVTRLFPVALVYLSSSALKECGNKCVCGAA